MNFNPLITAKDLDNLDIDKYHAIVAELSQIDRNHIESELETITTVYGYYYGLMVRAERLFNESVTHLDTFRATRKSMLRAESKKTVDALNDLVNSEPDVEELNKVVAKNEEIYNLMKGITYTLGYKKDMLIQLSANRREEIKLHR